MKHLFSLKNIVPAALIFLCSCSAKQPDAGTPAPETFPVIQVSETSATTYTEYPAAIEGVADVEIRAQVSGYLDKVLVSEGALVSAGQPLFKINDRVYRELLNSASANVSAAESAIINAQLEIDKITPLVENKVVAPIQLKMAQAAYKIAEANAQQAKAAVASAKINLGYTTIKAPTNGYIGRLFKKRGTLVSAADAAALTTLSDVHEVHVYFSLSEADFILFKSNYAGKTIVDKIKNLPPVSLVLADNSINPQQGKVDIVDGQFDRSTGAITVRASFANPQRLLRSGNTGKIRLGLQHANALVIPQAATVEVQDKIYVYTVSVDSNKVSKQPISVVGKSGTDYLVHGGLKTGDRIVSKGLDHLQDGNIISPEKANLTVLNK